MNQQTIGLDPSAATPLGYAKPIQPSPLRRWWPATLALSVPVLISVSGALSTALRNVAGGWLGGCAFVLPLAGPVLNVVGIVLGIVRVSHPADRTAGWVILLLNAGALLIVVLLVASLVALFLWHPPVC